MTIENLFTYIYCRKYTDVKVTENIECEIMQVILDEVVELYPKRYLELPSNTDADYASNLSLISSVLD